MDEKDVELGIDNLNTSPKKSLLCKNKDSENEPSGQHVVPIGSDTTIANIPSSTDALQAAVAENQRLLVNAVSRIESIQKQLTKIEWDIKFKMTVLFIIYVFVIF